MSERKDRQTDGQTDRGQHCRMHAHTHWRFHTHNMTKSYQNWQKAVSRYTHLGGMLYIFSSPVVYISDCGERLMRRKGGKKGKSIKKVRNLQEVRSNEGSEVPTWKANLDSFDSK